MPELPEVETVARQLNGLIRGRHVNALNILDSKLGSPRAFAVRGKEVVRVFRAGKEVVLELRRDSALCYLAVHLRMTGRLIWRASNERAQAELTHVRAVFLLEGGKLHFVDPRRFGTFRLEKRFEDVQPLGLDPLNQDVGLRQVREWLNESHQPIKSWLLRQDRLVGLGNIYACEILYGARIHPQRSCSSLNDTEIKRLCSVTRSVLKKAVENCGTTFSDFQDSRGSVGSFQKFLKVYKRENEPCAKCQRNITRIVQQQRSTFFCPSCQL